MQNNLKTPAIFNIQHCCTQDGPGLRSVVFVKGCPLRCQWCQNPESWISEPEIGFKADKCLGCGQCLKFCPSGAISKPGQKNNEKCSGCRCSEICPSGAIVKFGEYLSPKELAKKLAPEFPYFRRTGGGVTFSGGEAGLYPEFIAETASLLKSEGIHTAMETCGLWACKNGSDIFNGGMLSNLDMILFDIKLFDDEAHRKYCGSLNITIKDRFILLADYAIEKAARCSGPDCLLFPE